MCTGGNVSTQLCLLQAWCTLPKNKNQNERELSLPCFYTPTGSTPLVFSLHFLDFLFLSSFLYLLNLNCFQLQIQFFKLFLALDLFFMLFLALFMFLKYFIYPINFNLVFKLFLALNLVFMLFLALFIYLFIQLILKLIFIQGWGLGFRDQGYVQGQIQFLGDPLVGFRLQIQWLRSGVGDEGRVIIKVKLSNYSL